MKADSTRYSQRGISLIEAMISILLVAVLGLGMAYATSRALLIQRYATTQSLAIVQMREYLQTRDPDQQQVSMAGTTLAIDAPDAERVVDVSIAGAARDITLTGQWTLGVSSTDLFSGDGKVSLSY